MAVVNMGTEGSSAYGVSGSAVASLIDEIRAKIITEVSNVAADTSEIKKACEENWKGTSKERFLTNLDRDVTILQDALMTMYRALVTEINATADAIFDFDQNLID